MNDQKADQLGIVTGGGIFYDDAFVNQGKVRHWEFLERFLDTDSPPAPRNIQVCFWAGDDVFEDEAGVSVGANLTRKERSGPLIHVVFSSEQLHFDDKAFRDLLCGYVSDALEVGLAGVASKVARTAGPVLRARLERAIAAYQAQPLPLPQSQFEIGYAKPLATRNSAKLETDIVQHYFYFPTKAAATAMKAACTAEALKASVRRDGEEYLCTFEAPSARMDEEAISRLERTANSLGGDYDGWAA